MISASRIYLKINHELLPDAIYMTAQILPALFKIPGFVSLFSILDPSRKYCFYVSPLKKLIELTIFA